MPFRFCFAYVQSKVGVTNVVSILSAAAAGSAGPLAK
jgi:hypothetical protein